MDDIAWECDASERAEKTLREVAVRVWSSSQCRNQLLHELGEGRCEFSPSSAMLWELDMLSLELRRSTQDLCPCRLVEEETLVEWAAMSTCPDRVIFIDFNCISLYTVYKLFDFVLKKMLPSSLKQTLFSGWSTRRPATFKTRFQKTSWNSWRTRPSSLSHMCGNTISHISPCWKPSISQENGQRKQNAVRTQSRRHLKWFSCRHGHFFWGQLKRCQHSISIFAYPSIGYQHRKLWWLMKVALFVVLGWPKPQEIERYEALVKRMVANLAVRLGVCRSGRWFQAEANGFYCVDWQFEACRTWNGQSRVRLAWARPWTVCPKSVLAFESKEYERLNFLALSREQELDTLGGSLFNGPVPQTGRLVAWSTAKQESKGKRNVWMYFLIICLATLKSLSRGLFPLHGQRLLHKQRNHLAAGFEPEKRFVYLDIFSMFMHSLQHFWLS